MNTKDTKFNIEKMFGRYLNSKYETAIDDWEYIQKLFDYTLETKPSLVLETGTYAGRSGIAILTAMRINKKGRFITLDNNFWMPGAVELALERFNRLRFKNVEYINCNTLNPTEQVKDQRYDFIFLDTVHRYSHVKKELEIYSGLTDKIFIHDTKIKDVSKAVLEFIGDKWDLTDYGTRFGLWLITRKPIKTLIVTTAKDRPLLNTWLPSLLGKGEYKGDILIIDYDLNEHAINRLREYPNVSIVKANQKYICIASDRHRAFYEALKDVYKKYTTILIIDGSDIEFLKPIQPLFDLAKEEVCYVTEGRVNGAWVKYAGPPDAKEVWEFIKNRLIINAGVYVGPAELIFKIQEHIAENLVYNSGWGSDQLLLNAMIYYYRIPSKEIDRMWNFDARPFPILDMGTLTGIAILHRI